MVDLLRFSKWSTGRRTWVEIKVGLGRSRGEKFMQKRRAEGV
jgi:hypothetical protein